MQDTTKDALINHALSMATVVESMIPDLPPRGEDTGDARLNCAVEMLHNLQHGLRQHYTNLTEALSLDS